MVDAYLSYVNYEILLLGGHWVLLVKLKLNTMGICTWVLDEIMAMQLFKHIRQKFITSQGKKLY